MVFAVCESGLGAIKIHIGKPNSTMPAEFWSERAIERIMKIVETAPPELRVQAEHFKEKMQYVIAGAVNSAVSERRARDALLAERKDPEIAQMIREDK